MIRSIRHKGLKRLFERDDPSGVNPEHISRLVVHMDLPGYRLHQLKGRMKGFWAVTVRANWRVIFRFAEGHAEDVDYLNYH